MYLIDLLLHRVPWNGDKIRLYRRESDAKETFIGEFNLQIKSDAVFVDGSYIRRDLPTWSYRFSCWEYFFSYSGG